MRFAQNSLLILALATSFTFGTDETLAKSKKTFVENSPVEYRTLKADALKALKRGDSKTAELLFRKAEKSLGTNKDYADLRAEMQANLALIFQRQHMFSKAEEELEKAIQILEDRYGMEGGRLPPFLDLQATVCLNKSKKMAILMRSLRIQEKLVGKDNSSILLTLGQIHDTESGSKRTETMLRIYTIRKKKPGYEENSNSPNVAFSLARGYLSQGNYAEAAKYTKESADLARGLYGKENPMVLKPRIFHGILFREIGKVAEGNAEIKQCLSIAKTVDPNVGPSGLAVLFNAAFDLLEYKDKSTAADLMAIIVSKAHLSEVTSAEQILSFDLNASKICWQANRKDAAIKYLKTYIADMHNLAEKDSIRTMLNDARAELQKEKYPELAKLII